jgi:GTP-binding protein Era
MNALVGEKVAITTPVPQTTRHVIRGILHRPDVQVVFTDTPGIHKPKTLLGSRLNEVARASLSDVDVIVFLVDGEQGIGKGDRFLASLLADVHTPVIACVSKVDTMKPIKQLPVLQRLTQLGSFDEIVPVSAISGENVETLLGLIVDRLPEGPPYFPPEQVTDQTLERRMAEVIREKVITHLREEVPHSVAVVVEEILPGESEGVQVVHATLFVERDSQKGIVIGHRGEGMARIGTEARPELEELAGSRVYLDLRVKLSKEWQRDPKKLERLGY